MKYKTGDVVLYLGEHAFWGGNTATWLIIESNAPIKGYSLVGANLETVGRFSEKELDTDFIKLSPLLVRLLGFKQTESATTF